jgi:flagellar protein FliO/FliZ
MTNADVESVSLVRVVLAFIAVGGLLAFFGFILKYFKMRGFRMPGMQQDGRRLHIVENLMIDPRRRLVIVRCDNSEHLLLLGVNQDIVVEANLDRSPAYQVKGNT